MGLLLLLPALLAAGVRGWTPPCAGFSAALSPAVPISGESSTFLTGPAALLLLLPLLLSFLLPAALLIALAAASRANSLTPFLAKFWNSGLS